VIDGTLEVSGEGFLTGVHLTFHDLATFSTSFGALNDEFLSFHSDDGQFNLFFHTGIEPSLIGGLNDGRLHGGSFTSPSSIGLGVLATDIRGTAACAATCPPIPVPVGQSPIIALLLAILVARIWFTRKPHEPYPRPS
jgi:hypothetical protein